MPTFTNIASLPRSQFTSSSHLKHQNYRGRLYIPALYITPEPTPVSGSSVDSLTPSPYVFNRKGRVGKGFVRVEDERKSNGREFGDDGDLRGEQGVPKSL